MLKNNTVLKILSLAIAFFLWIYVMGEVNPTTAQTIENIPVELLNENTLAQRELAIQGGTSFSVDIIVEGKRADLNSLDKSKIKATADLFGYEEGENYIPVSVDVPENVSLKEIKTPKIQVALEELVSVYKDITVAFTGKTEKNTEPGNISVSPAQIEVKGAKSTVNSVETVRAEVDASKITTDLQKFTAEPMAIDKQGDVVYDVSLSTKTVDVEAALYYTKTVPLKVKVKGSVPDQYEMTDISVPRKIAIRGPKDTVDRINSVTAADIDLSKVKASTTLAIKPELPAGVEVAGDSRKIGVKVTIKGIATKTFKVLTKNSKINNLDDGLNAYINTAEITVIVTGTERVVSAATAEDFAVSVDLEGLKIGSHSVVANVTADKAFSSMKVKPKKVEITINKENSPV